MFERIFSHAANWVAERTGHPIGFVLALAVILVWALTGPFFGYSDTWQLVINTGTTIVTFLMVFIIQNTQNRDAQAMQVKLDELIRANRGADNALIDLELLTESEIAELHKRYSRIAERAKELGVDLKTGKRVASSGSGHADDDGPKSGKSGARPHHKAAEAGTG